MAVNRNPWPGELLHDIRTVAAGVLQSSPAYQREVNENRVRRIVRSFQPSAFGTILVARRSDGTYWVLDGLQRFTAAVRLGFTGLPCVVVESAGEAHEAELFRLTNQERTSVPRLTQFHARLTEGEPAAREIAQIIYSAGLEIASAKKDRWPYVRAIGAIERCHRAGGEWLGKSLRIITAAWPGDNDSIAGEMIEGVGLFFRSFAGIDEKRLRERLASTTPKALMADAAARRRLTNSSQSGRAGSCCDAVAAVYSKGLRKRLANRD